MTRSKPPGHPVTQAAERPASGGPLAAVRAFRLVLAAAVLCAAMGASAGAQSWQSRINDSGAFMSGVAFVPGNTLAFSCTAPSPSGRQLIETGDHEAQRTDTPFTMIVTIGAGLLDPFVDGSDLAQPLATLDATTFGLPPMPWDEFFGNWHTTLSMGDRMFVAARGAGSLVLDPGRGTAYSFPADGLGDALVRAMSYCITGWQLAGHSVPPDLMPILQAAAVQAPAEVSTPAPAQTQGLPAAPVSPAWPGYAPIRSSRLPDGYRFAPLLPLPPTPPPQGDAHLTALCQGAWYSDPDHVQVADLDGDGREDYVLNWSGVQCQGGVTGRAYCGAANCQIDVFLSARGYADPVGLLGVAADVVLDDEGRIGLLLAGTASVCAGGFCDTPFYWDGSDLSQRVRSGP
jgi:hypothetical protein